MRYLLLQLFNSGVCLLLCALQCGDFAEPLAQLCILLTRTLKFKLKFPGLGDLHSLVL